MNEALIDPPKFFVSLNVSFKWKTYDSYAVGCLALIQRQMNLKTRTEVTQFYELLCITHPFEVSPELFDFSTTKQVDNTAR